MGQGSLGYNEDDETNPDVMPEEAQDRASTAGDSPGHQLAAEANPVTDADKTADATPQGTTPEEDAQSAALNSMALQPAAPKAPAQVAPSPAQSPQPDLTQPNASRPDFHAPRQIGQIDPVEEQPVYHRLMVDPQMEAQAQAEGRQQAAAQMQQDSQAQQQRIAKINSSDPYQGDDGRWKKQAVDPSTGAINEHDVIDSGMGTTDRRTGNIFVNTINGPQMVGSDPQQKALAQTVNDKALAMAQGSQATVQIAAARQDLLANAQQIKSFGGVPQRMQAQIAKFSQAAQDPNNTDAQDQLQQVTSEFNTWKGQNPLYNAAILSQQNTQARIQALNAAKVSANARVQDALTAHQYVQVNGNLPPGYGSQPSGQDDSQSSSDVSGASMFQRAGEIQASTGLPFSIAQAQALAEAKQNGAKTVSGADIGQSMSGIDLSSSVQKITPQQLRTVAGSGLISKAQAVQEIQRRNTVDPNADNGVGAVQDFAVRALGKFSSVLNGAMEGVSRAAAGIAGQKTTQNDDSQGLAGVNNFADLAQYFKGNVDDVDAIDNGQGGLTNPSKNKTIGAGVADAVGFMGALATGERLIAPAMAVMGITEASIGGLAIAGRAIKVLQGARQMAPALALMLPMASAEAYDEAKKNGATDQNATQAGMIGAMKQLPMLLAYGLGGKLAGALERRFLPPVINPLARGAVRLVSGGAANVAASTAVRAGETAGAAMGVPGMQAQPIMPTLQNSIQDLAFAGHGALDAMIHESGLPKMIATAQDIAAGTDPVHQSMVAASQHPDTPPKLAQAYAARAAKMQADAVAFLKQYKQPQIAPGTKNDPDAQAIVDMHAKAQDLRAKIQTAFASGDPDAQAQASAHTEALQETEGQLHQATQAMMGRVSPDLQARIAKMADPDGDWDATAQQNAANPIAHFATENLGRAMRDHALAPDRQRRIRQVAIASGADPDIADHIANQALGAKAVRDLGNVLRGTSIDRRSAEALRNMGMLTGDPKDPTAPPHVTEDAKNLLPKGQQDFAAKRPDIAKYSPAETGARGDALYRNATAGMENFARTARRMAPPKVDAQPDLQAQQPATTNVGDALERAQRPTERSRADIQKEIKQRAAELAREKSPDMQKALAGRIRELSDQLGQAPQKSVKGEAIDETKLTDSQRRLTGEVRKEFMRNKALFDALGVKAPTLEGAPGTSGLHMGDDGMLKLDPRAMEADISKVVGPDSKPLTEIEKQGLLRARMREEMTHRIQILAEGGGDKWRKNYGDLWNDPDLDPALKEMARQSYVGFDKLSDEAKGAEAVRMVLDAKWHGTITERIFRAIQGVVNYLRGLKIDESRSQLFREIVARAENARDEAKLRAQKGEAYSEDARSTESTGEPMDAKRGGKGKSKSAGDTGNPEPEPARTDEDQHDEHGPIPEGASTDFVTAEDERNATDPVRDLTPEEKEQWEALQKEHEESMAQEPLMREKGFTTLREAVAKLGGIPSKNHPLRKHYGEELTRVEEALRGYDNRVKASNKQASHFNLFRKNADSPDRVASQLGFGDKGANSMFEALEHELSGGATHWVNPHSDYGQDYGQEQQQISNEYPLFASKSRDKETPDMFAPKEGELQLNTDAVKDASERAQNFARTWQHLTAKMTKGEPLTQGEENAYRMAEKELGQQQLFEPTPEKMAANRAAETKHRQVSEILRRQNERLRARITQGQPDLFEKDLFHPNQPNAGAGAGAEEPEAAREARSDRAAAEKLNPIQAINRFRRVDVTIPEGASLIRATDNKGRKLEPVSPSEFHAKGKKGDNPFHDADIVKLEAGFKDSKGKFVVVPGEVGVEERKEMLAASPVADFKDDMREQSAWLSHEAEAQGYEDAGDMRERDEDGFNKLTQQWRSFHARDEQGTFLHNNASEAINKKLYGSQESAETGEETNAGGRLAGTSGALGDAITHTRGSEPPGRRDADSETAGEKKQRSLSESRSLIEWAKANGLLIDHLPEQYNSETNKGGGEHDVWYTPHGRWLKATGTNGVAPWGMTPIVTTGKEDYMTQEDWHTAPATPLDYLQNVQDRNNLTGDDTRLHGVMIDAKGMARIVVSQPDIGGQKTTQDRITESMEKSGFRQVDKESYYRGSDNTLVSDVHNENAKEVNGQIFIIDGGVSHPSQAMIDAIQETRRDWLFNRAKRDRDAARDMSLAASKADTGAPEDGDTPQERLAREAEQAGVVFKTGELTGLIRGDQAAMDAIRAKIKARTGKDALFASKAEEPTDAERVRDEVSSRLTPAAKELHDARMAGNVPEGREDAAERVGRHVSNQMHARGIAPEDAREALRPNGDLAASPIAAVRAAYDRTADALADEAKRIGSKNAIAYKTDAVTNRANLTAGQAATAIRHALPDARDREAMPWIVESGKDPKEQMNNLLSEKAKIASSNDPKLAKKWMPVVDHAISNVNRLNARRPVYDRVMAEHLARQKAEGVEPAEVDNYVAHRLEQPDLRDKPLFDMGNSSGGTNKFYTKGRVFATLGDAIHAGYDPKSTDLADLAQHRIEAGEKVIGQKQLFRSLETVKSPVDGLPIIGKEEERQTIASKAAMADYQRDLAAWKAGGSVGEPPDKPSHPKAIPKGYQSVNAGGARLIVHDAEAPIFKDLYGDSALRRFAAGRLALKAAAGIKGYTLMGDTFHVGRVLYKMAVSGGGLPTRMVDGRPEWNFGKGRALVEYDDRDLAQGVANKEITQKDADFARANRGKFNKLVDAGMNIGRVMDNLMQQAHANLPGLNAINKWIFGKLSRSAMVQSSFSNLERNLKNPRYTEAEAYRQTAKEMNETFGNLQNQGVFKSKTLQDLSRLIFLAPQWTESQFRAEGRAYGQAGKSLFNAAAGKDFRLGNATRIFAGGFVSLLAANQIVNLLTRGQTTFQNKEDGRQFSSFIPGGKNGFFFDPLEVAGQYAWAAHRYLAQHQSPVDSAMRIVGNKLSPLARATQEALGGRGWDGKHFLNNTDRFRSAASNLVPMPIGLAGLVERDPRQLTGFRLNRKPGSLEQQGLSSIGLRVDPAQSPGSAMMNLAQPFRPSRQGGDTTGEYTQLRQALDNRDAASARSEIEWLQGQGKTPDAILHSAGIRKDGSTAPELFTGNRDAEKQFLASLSPEHRALYQQAQQDHVVNARFLRMVMASMRHGSKS